MSLSITPSEDTVDDADIQVTSPTSLALRDSMMRRSSSTNTMATIATQQIPDGPPPLRATASSGDRLSSGSSRLLRNSFFTRAPPPPPPQHPPQVPPYIQTAALPPPAPTPSHSPPASAMMTRPSSNPSLAALHASSESSNPNHSLGPTSLATTPMGSSTNNLSFIGRKPSARRSILRETFSALTRDKDNTPATIPEGMSMDVKCEGFLTKRGHVFTNWKTRYFVLRGNVLEYFAGEDKGKKYGSVTVAKVAPWSGESHGFMFYTTKQIPYYVYAASEAERAKWLRALKEFYVEPEEVTCEGYLTKRGHLVPSQRMAYYVLNGTSLRHYADQPAYRENQSAMAEVEIKALSSWDGESNGLMFKTVTGNVFYVIADNTMEQQKWLNSFKHVAANIPEPVSCAGYLTKQGHKRKSWKKRYFILRGNMISYYSDYDIANNSKGKPLAEVNVEDVQKWDGEPFGFMFMTTEQVPYYVYADNERERTKWMNALRKLNTVQEEEEVEKKRCPNCNAVLTGSRFCGACGYNLRGTTVKERSTKAKELMNADPLGNDSVSKDDADLDDDDTPFDELEALSEGARTLLLAVMQTPDGVDIGDKDGAFPIRTTNARLTSSDIPVDLAPEKRASRLELEIAEALEESKDQKPQVDTRPMVSPVAMTTERASSARSPVLPTTRSQKVVTNEEPATDAESLDSFAMPKPTNKTPEPTKRTTLVPNFAIVEENDVKNASFTSFGDSEEETKVDPKPVPQRTPPPPMRSSTPGHRGNIGPRRTLNQLMMESSSDEEDEPDLPTRPPSASYEKATEKEEKREDDEEEKLQGDQKPNRKSSADSDILDTTGIAGFDDEFEKPKLHRPSSVRLSEQSAKNDLYHHMERELNFTPLFVPSAESPVRCRLYSSMAYASAKKVIMFIADSGPMGLWKQDPTDQTTTIQHKWVMLKYFYRAQEDGYGIIVCNPFSNTAVVYEAGGFERVVPIPNSATPKEHVLFVWDQFASKCKGEISIIAFARGGALVKSILETYETTAQEKIHRIAFVESRHEIDASDSPNVRSLLGRRSINWEASYEPLGGQIVESQERVGCVCLSIGFMPPHNVDADNTPVTLEKAVNAVFAFIGANPDRPGMTAVVKHVRMELRRRKSTTPTNKPRRQSNILVLGETDGDEENSDISTGDAASPSADEIKSTEKPLQHPGAPYYLPKPVNKPRTPSQRSGATNGSQQQRRHQIAVTDFELLKVVGQGGFGKVFLCRKLTAPHQGESFAMKVLKKQHVVSSGLVNTTMAERKILTEISHPFVVKLHYAFQSESKLYLVMDYLSGGSLAFHLRRRRRFPEEWARFYAAEVAAAIAHLHSVNIIYRDAKLENVLMDHEGHVRITDFGLSKVGVSDLKGATTFCGTAAYIAPELLKGNAYGKAADWWSFGILLYEMIGGKPPYYHRNRDIMFQTILKQEWVTFSPNFSDAAVSLIRGLLTRDPMMRLGSGPRGADEVLTHPFFDGIHWPDLLQKKIAPPFNPGVGKLDTHYAPRHLNEITPHDREASFAVPGAHGSNPTTSRPHANDFDGFSFVGRPSSLSGAPPPSFNGNNGSNNHLV